MMEYVGPIEKQTLDNTYFRQVLFTGKHTQLVVMCLEPGEEIGDEVHPNVDQFFRIEQGEAKFVFNEKLERPVRDGAEFVLSPLRKPQLKELDELLEHAAEAVESIIAEGVEKAMTRFNRRARGKQTEEE